MPIAAPPSTSIAEQNVKQNRSFWAKYEWPKGGDEWSDAMGGTRSLWNTIIRPRISSFIPTGSILEIAPGHGRCTQFLLDLCERLTIVDLVPECINACRERFGDRPGLTYAVNDGSTLPMVADKSVDFAFTWDSLVHVERDTIRSYVRELARVPYARRVRLRPPFQPRRLHLHPGEVRLGEGPARARQDHVRRGYARGLHRERPALREPGAGPVGIDPDLHGHVLADPARRRPRLQPDADRERNDWLAEMAQANRIARLYQR